MTKDDITTRQAQRIYDALFPALGFLTQLETRLSDLGFPSTDGYVEKVRAAREAFMKLTVETHYLSCGCGVGRHERR